MRSVNSSGNASVYSNYFTFTVSQDTTPPVIHVPELSPVEATSSAGAPVTGAGDIFISDFDGDGTTGDVVPGSNVGSFMRSVGPHNINNLINSYNTKWSNQLTPAGTQVVKAGVLTAAQMQALQLQDPRCMHAPSGSA